MLVLCALKIDLLSHCECIINKFNFYSMLIKFVADTFNKHSGFQSAVLVTQILNQTNFILMYFH